MTTSTPHLPTAGTVAPRAWVDRVRVVTGRERVTLEDSERAGRLVTPAALLRAAGFGEHLMAGEESVLDLALRVCAESEEADGPLDPDMVVHACALPGSASSGDAGAYERSGDVKHLMRFTVSEVLAERGWSRAVALGLTQQGCAGVLGAWRVAASMLASEGWDEVVSLSADRFPAGALYEQSFNPISDAASLTRISTTPGPRAFELLGVHQITNGGLNAAGDTETAGSFFVWTHRVVAELLERLELRAGDVDWVAPQNTHRSSWEVLGRLLSIDPARVATPTLASAGHLISGDNLLNLVALEESGRLEEGQKVLVTAAGYGANWAAALLEVGPR